MSDDDDEAYLECDRVDLVVLVDDASGLVKLDQLAVGLVLYEPVHIVVGGVVPHPVGAQLHRVRVLGGVKVRIGVTAHIAPAPNVATDETNPQVLVRAALHTRVVHGIVGRLHVAAHRTRRVHPLGQTARVERVIAEDGDDTVERLVHALEADVAGGQLGEAGHGQRRAAGAGLGRVAGLDALDKGQVADELRFDRVERPVVVEGVEVLGAGVRGELDQRHVLVGLGVAHYAHVLERVGERRHEVDELVAADAGRDAQHAEEFALAQLPGLAARPTRHHRLVVQ